MVHQTRGTMVAKKSKSGDCNTSGQRKMVQTGGQTTAHSGQIPMAMDLETTPQRVQHCLTNTPSIPAAANDTDGDGYPDDWTALDNGSNYSGGLFLDNCPNVWGNSTSALSLVNGSYVSVSYYGCQDTDGDGREDSTDAFPADPTQVADSDGDGWGDNQQGNDPDACPFDAGVINGTKPDGTPGIGCPIPSDDPDEDFDGVPDDNDDCPNTQFGQVVNEIGCSEYQIDDDLDGVSNAEDRCPNTPIEHSCR